MIRYAVRIPVTLKKRIDAHKERTGVQYWHFTMRALEEKLDREEQGRAA